MSSRQPPASSAGLYLVATLRFWKNAFKYNSFSYHVVTQDVGALLASWRLVLAAAGLAVEPVLWFDEAPISTALARGRADRSTLRGGTARPSRQALTGER